MFPVIQVDRHRSDAPELLGTKRKFWFLDDAGFRWLFKAEERGTGEDWAEKISCELAARLGLPHVHYELAEETDATPGVVCASISTNGRQLVLGNRLLLERDTDYPTEDREETRTLAVPFSRPMRFVLLTASYLGDATDLACLARDAISAYDRINDEWRRPWPA